MGNRRMISKTITQTQRFLQMPLETQALYFHLIQHSDDDGVVEAFPIVRMIGSSEDSLNILQAKRFIVPLNDEMIYFIVDFHEQNVIRSDRKVNSVHLDLLKNIIPDAEIIEPKQRADRVKKSGQPKGDNGTTIGLPNISKDNISKGNISKGSSKAEKELTTTPPILNENLLNLYKVFEEETGRSLTQMQIQDLQYMIEDYSFELIQEALREAVRQGKANFAYITSILKRWKQDGLMTPELVRNAKAAREKKKDSIQNEFGNDTFPELPF